MNHIKTIILYLFLFVSLTAVGAGAATSADDLSILLDLERNDLARLVPLVGDRAAFWRELVNHYRDRRTPAFPYNPADREGWRAEYRRLYPTAASELIRDAKRLLRKPVADAVPGPTIPYHYLFPGNHTIDSGSRLWGADWVLLGRAWWLSGDEVYAEAALDRIMALAEQEGIVPAALGEWSGILAGVRLWNLVQTWSLCLGSETFDGPSTSVTIRFIAALAERLMGQAWEAPERSLVGMSALTVAGALFPELKGAERFHNAGRNGVEKGVASAVLPDGVLDGGSPGRHCLTLWHLFRAQLILSRSGMGFSEPTRNQIEAMFDFLNYASRPDGTIMVPDGPVEIQAAPLLQAASVRFDRADLKPDRLFKLHPELCWALGTEAASGYRSLESREPEAVSGGFPYGGHLVLRSDWRPTARYLNLRYGSPPTDEGRAGQGMNPLGIVLSAFERNLILDMGVGLGSGHFDLEPRLNHFRPGDGSGFIAASYCFVEDSGDSLKHVRKVFSPAYDYWIVADRLSRSGGHRFEEVLVLSDLPVQIDREKQEVLLGQGPGGCLLIKNLLPDGWSMEMQPSSTAGRGGRLKWTRTGSDGVGFYLLLYPYRTRGEVVRPPVTAEVLPVETESGLAGTDSSLAVSIHRPGFTDIIMIWSGKKGVEKEFGSGKMAWDLFWERLNPLGQRMVKERWENPL
jgi:hypothetical protein